MPQLVLACVWRTNRGYNIVGFLVSVFMLVPVTHAKKPKEALKPRKIRKVLKKVERLDDLHYIPLYRDYDMNKVARSFTNESNLSYFSDTWKRGLGQG